MTFKREEHEDLLSELLTPELEHSRKTEILSKLRDNYTEFTTTYESLSKTKEKLERDNADLVISNSKLFRQTGVYGEPVHKQEDQVKEFSETITIEQLEKGL
jgi:Ulp1 family protease